MKKLTTYFTKGELALWGGSAGLILVSFFLFDRVNFMTLAASLIGTTSLIFNAKGNPIGQALMILFSLLYGVISYTFSYFGEMITYLGMTGPMALFAYVSWLRNSSILLDICNFKLALFIDLVLTNPLQIFIPTAYSFLHILPFTIPSNEKVKIIYDFWLC